VVIRDVERSGGLGVVYMRQASSWAEVFFDMGRDCKRDR
jgi:hypothetical protein